MRAALDLLACALLLASSGCRTPPAPQHERGLDELVTVERGRMHVRYRSVQDIEISIAIADLERAHTAARWIVGQDDPDVLPEWRPYVADIRLAAADVGESGDTVAAARAMARLGRACARCHEATEARISFVNVSQPSGAGKLADQMARHQWAAARMWEGLIGPSDDRWRDGARALEAAPTTLTAESGELGIADDAARTKELAGRALTTGDQDARSELYGDLLATCARCHATIRSP